MPIRHGTLAIVAVLGVCAGLAAIAQLSRAMAGHYGPSAGIRLPDGRTLIGSHGQLHVFEGMRRTERIALSEFGLGSIAGDLDVLRNGELLVGDTATRRLMRCRLADRSCRVFFDGGIRGAFKAEVEPGAGRVVLTDSSNHRLLLLDPEGRQIAASAINGPRFNFPNGLAFGADGLIAVADTDNRRLALMRLEGDMLRPEPDDISLAAALGPVTGFFPIDVRPDARGRWWVIVANNGLERGALFVLHPDGRLLRQLPLGADPDPIALVALPDAMLVLEPSTFAVTRLTLEGSAQPFGDRAFSQELAAERERVQWLSNARLAVQALLVAFCCGVLFAAVRAGGGGMLRQLRMNWSIPQTPLPLTEEQVWIEANPRPMRMTVLAMLLATAFLLAFLWLYLPSVMKLDPAREAALWKASLFLLALPFFTLLFLHRPRTRLGTDGKSIFLFDGSGHWSAPLAEVRYSPTRLLVGHRVVRLRIPGADFFPVEEIAGRFLSRLPPEALLPEWRFTLLALKTWFRQWRRPK